MKPKEYEELVKKFNNIEAKIKLYNNIKDGLEKTKNALKIMESTKGIWNIELEERDGSLYLDGDIEVVVRDSIIRGLKEEISRLEIALEEL